MTDFELQLEASIYVSNNRTSRLVTYRAGFESGYKYFDNEMTDLLNSYGIRFMDCDSFGGVIGLHHLYEDVQKENEKLKATLSKIETVTENSSEVEQAFKQGQESMLFDFAIEDRHTLLEVIEEQKEYIKTLEERICSLKRKNANLELANKEARKTIDLLNEKLGDENNSSSVNCADFFVV